MRRAAALPLVLLLLAVGAAQTSPGDAKAQPSIRIGVALLRNTSPRTIATRVQRDQLIRSINQVNRKDDAKKGRAKLEAIALDADSAPQAAQEARDKHCDLIVYSNLRDLREPNDPISPVRVGPDGLEVTTADPLSVPAHPPGSLNPATYALVGFRLQRLGDPQPLVVSSVSATEQMDAEATVSLLMVQVASRVATEARKTLPPVAE
jgi:hypothetical protein